MRFGLADLEELPSLKEFEQLAQAALGADDGIAPTEPDEASGAQGILAGADPVPEQAFAIGEAEQGIAPEPPLAESVAPAAENAEAANSESASSENAPPETKAATSRG